MKAGRRSIRISIIYFVMILVYSFSANAQQTKKNLLFIITDQQRYDALSFAGNTVLETPNLDQLAQQGVYFQNAYTPCAVCGPARSSILTGHTIENTGVNSNSKTYYYDEEPVMEMPTFDEILSDSGYHCEYYGKWHVLSSHAEIYKNPIQVAENGRHIFGPGGQSQIYRDYLNTLGEIPAPGAGEFLGGILRYPYKADPLDKYFGTSYEELEAQGIKHTQPEQHGELKLDQEHTLTAYQAKETIAALERLQDSTFSITCSFHFPHAPMLPSEPYYSMYPPEEMVPPVSISDDMRYSPYERSNSRLNNPEYADPELIKYMISNYYGLVKEIDVWVGKILDKLDELDLADNTLVIFTSDHGEMLGAHGMREKNIFYEESAHIPLLMRFPDEINPETRVNGYVSLVDLFPTILDYLHAGEHASDGKSLRGLIEGTDNEHGKYVVTEWNSNGDNTPNYMIVKDGWKLFIPFTATSSVLNAMYDLNTDPHEMDNLIGGSRNSAEYFEKAEELRASLLEWLAKNNSVHYNGVRDRELTETPYVPKAEVLVARGSTWQYHDDGSNLGTAWREIDYDDSGWASGPAEFGFGDDDEATKLQSGHITYYFRHHFTIDTLEKYKNPLYMDLLVDDGAVIYLNGVKLSRSNMPSDSITATTLAKMDITGSNEYQFFGRLYSVDGLLAGENVVAVEVHQSSGDSDDLSFDLGLEATPNEVTDISVSPQNLPQEFSLAEPYPNPFNPTTVIGYNVPEFSKVRLSIYNVLGQKVSELVNRESPAGKYEIEWNAENLGSGVYIVVLRTNTKIMTKKITLIK